MSKKPDRNDHESILARLETMMVDKNIPDFLQANKRLFKFKSMLKQAKSNLNSVRQKISDGKSFVDDFSNGSIWCVTAVHTVPDDKQTECSQLISQFFTNGHNLRPKQNDEVVERLLGLCGYINFLEANSNEDIFKFLWALYPIRAMAAPSSNTVVPSTTVAISPEKMKEILRKQEDGEKEQEQQLPNFRYDDVDVIPNRENGELRLLKHDIATNTITVEYPVVVEEAEVIEYTLSEYDHVWVKRPIDKPKVEEEIVERTLVDEHGKKIKKKTTACNPVRGTRETYQWRKTGKKLQKTVKRQFAVEKVTTHSRKVNDKWKKTGNMLEQEYTYCKKEWKSRNDTRLLYNKHSMNVQKKPIHPEITTVVVLDDGKGMVKTVQKFDTQEYFEIIDSYQLIAVTALEETRYPVEKKVSDVVVYAETLQDQEEIIWSNTEHELEWRDVIVEVDDWECVLVEEEYDEHPHIVEGQHEDITYPSFRASCVGFESFEIEEQVWTRRDIVKTVEINTKVEKMQKKDYLLSNCKQL